MRTKGRKRTILLALTSTHHGFYRGAARYAAEHDWHIVADIIYDATIPVGWRGDGILSFVGHWDDLAKYVTSAGVPVVEISSVRKDLGVPSVMEDNDAIGRLGRRTLTRAKSEEFCLGAFQWIKVALVDTTLDDTSKVVTAIATDNAAGGAAAADALAKLIGEKGKVLVIAFQAGASTSDQRQKGFENEIKKYPNI